uniref:PH domain-containing protein n=1 Tax=Anopheles atroparvus TaxID=41427 RepID=A0A182IQB1_ANOAO
MTPRLLRSTSNSCCILYHSLDPIQIERHVGVHTRESLVAMVRTEADDAHLRPAAEIVLPAHQRSTRIPVAYVAAPLASDAQLRLGHLRCGHLVRPHANGHIETPHADLQLSLQGHECVRFAPTGGGEVLANDFLRHLPRPARHADGTDEGTVFHRAGKPQKRNVVQEVATFRLVQPVVDDCPDGDLHRRRWQRRWFVLYDDGELTYSVDEHPETIPQAIIDMTKVLEVTTADNITSHPHSIAVTAPDRVTFVKGTCPEETKWWFNVLAAFPKSKGRHKRNATFPGGQATTILQAQIDHPNSMLAFTELGASRDQHSHCTPKGNH